MDTFNLFRDDTIGDESDPPGYRARSAQLAPRFGASRLAMTVHDLPPGQAICPITSTNKHEFGIIEYPDSDKIGVWGRHDESLDHVIRRSPDLDYWDGEGR